MTHLLCASADCKWNGDDNYCTAEEVHLNDMSIMTMHDGRQHLWRCKQYEMSDMAKEFYEKFEALMQKESR